MAAAQQCQPVCDPAIHGSAAIAACNGDMLPYNVPVPWTFKADYSEWIPHPCPALQIRMNCHSPRGSRRLHRSPRARYVGLGLYSRRLRVHVLLSEPSLYSAPCCC